MEISSLDWSPERSTFTTKVTKDTKVTNTGGESLSFTKHGMVGATPCSSAWIIYDESSGNIMGMTRAPEIEVPEQVLQLMVDYYTKLCLEQHVEVVKMDLKWYYDMSEDKYVFLAQAELDDSTTKSFRVEHSDVTRTY